jgi:hypothetical protein
MVGRRQHPRYCLAVTASSTSTRIIRPVKALAACAIILGAALTSIMPAGAAVESQTYSIAGTLSVGGPPALTLPAGSTITFDLDSATGAITNGVTTIPVFDRGDVSGPQAEITLTDATPGTGTLDPATGAGSFTISFNVQLAVPLLDVVCTLATPVTVNVSTANAGGSPIAGDPATGVLTDDGFDVSAVAPGVTCPEESATLVNDFLGLPTNETSAAFTVTELVPPTPTPTPTPAPTPAPAVPSFTG